MAKYKIEQLPSGSYRVRKMIKGVSYTLVFDHKPTQNEITEELTTKQETTLKNDATLLFKDAAKMYNDSKRNTLSIATMREYDRNINRLPEWFTNTDVNSLDNFTMQKLVGELSATLSAKSVKDRYCYCTSVIRLFKGDLSFKVSLPEIIEKEPYIPTREEIKTILEVSKGTMFYYALRIACYGLRCEEICPLTSNDIIEEEGIYYINICKTIKQNTDNVWVLDERGKTKESFRYVPISEEFGKELIQLNGKIYEGVPTSISKYLKRTQDKLGMNRFSLHKFRHYFCTELADQIGEADLLYLGGWNKNNSTVMKRVYRHSRLKNDKEKMKNVINILN